jgi:hypothetical protein
MDAGERPRGRWATWRYRLWFDGPRKPLEPHRALPWLIRAGAWALLAIAFATFAVGAVAAAARTSIASHLAAVAGLLLALGLLARWASLPFRPTPVVLAPVDDED